MMKYTMLPMVVMAALLHAVPRTAAQSSSLFVVEPQQRNEIDRSATASAEATRPHVSRGQQRAPHQISRDVAAISFAAVKTPEPRRFAKHDLITVIIRESTETDFESSLDTEKEVGVDGEISDFPRLNLRDLLNAQLRPNDMEGGAPRVGVDFGNEFEGEGGYSRRESITGRMTAKVIDVKPNGMLVLEARKQLRTDDESLDLLITGSCRPEDVTIDNTILSTQLYDLRLDKQHEGELRNSTRKGLLTKIIDTIFNF
ncbi:MAG: flagellar basal body L-ring protein FlgH [Phycisphaeraceae bacterium]